MLMLAVDVIMLAGALGGDGEPYIYSGSFHAGLRRLADEADRDSQHQARSSTSSYERPSQNQILPLWSFKGNTDCKLSGSQPTAGELVGTCPEQVHLQLGRQGEMIVVWASQGSLNSTVAYGTAADSLTQTAMGTTEIYSQLTYFSTDLTEPSIGKPYASTQQILAIQNTSSWAKSKTFSSSYVNPTSVKWKLGEYKNPAAIYNSPYIHSVPLMGLSPGVRYYYQVFADSRVHSFVVPPSPAQASAQAAAQAGQPLSQAKPLLTLGLTADIGQTAVSVATMHALQAMQPDVAVIVGDLSYADGYFPRWDSFGRMIENLSATVPMLTAVGNHEISDAEAFVSYNARYPTPHLHSGSYDNTYYATEVGPVHYIALNSYAASAPGSAQYVWLQKDLATVDRSRTPWVIASMHAPWYNSNLDHQHEALLMQQNMEPIFHAAGVDIVIDGHVHSYERTQPVYQQQPNECGTVYLNLGDGGNREGTYVNWTLPQPSWSAFREASFGAASLEIMNDSSARFKWTRHYCEGPIRSPNFSTLLDPNIVPNNPTTGCITPGDESAQRMLGVDEFWIARSASSCPNKRASGPAATMGGLATGAASVAPAYIGPAPGPAAQGSNASGGDGEGLKAAVGVLCALLAVSILVNVAYIARARGALGASSSASAGGRRDLLEMAEGQYTPPAHSPTHA